MNYCRGSLTPAVHVYPPTGAGECGVCGTRFRATELMPVRVVPRHVGFAWGQGVLKAGPL